MLALFILRQRLLNTNAAASHGKIPVVSAGLPGILLLHFIEIDGAGMRGSRLGEFRIVVE